MLIETPRLALTTWERDDWQAFLPIAADPEVMQYVMHGATWDAAQVRCFIDQEIASYRSHGFCRYALRWKETAELIGFCGLKQPLKGGVVEMGWRLARRWWGQGIATEAAQAVVRHAFEHLAIKRLVAFIQLPNLASRRVAEKLGMEYRGECTRDGIRRGCYVLVHPARRP